MSNIVWGYGLEEWRRYGIRYPIKLPIDSHCHAIICGPSGSGKSQAVIWLIGELLRAVPDISMVRQGSHLTTRDTHLAVQDISITICDFKNSDDFRFLDSYENFYAGDSCYQGIMGFYEKFTQARHSGNHSSRHLLICDEYQALINYYQAYDKRNKSKDGIKYANDILSCFAEILMLGRSMKFSIWAVTQRASSELFLQGSRDNFQIILALGRQSREQRGMLFSGETLPADRIYFPGEGLLLADNHALKEVKFPLIEDMDSWKAHILHALCRSAGT